MRTPPGVSEADFAKALQQFAGVVGSQWVISGDEDVATYKDAYSPLSGEPEERLASAAVAPDSVEQIQKILAIANQFKIPLYTVSTGRNLAYGTDRSAELRRQILVGLRQGSRRRQHGRPRHRQ